MGQFRVMKRRTTPHSLRGTTSAWLVILNRWTLGAELSCSVFGAPSIPRKQYDCHRITHGIVSGE
jgi:hypothetical protein